MENFKTDFEKSLRGSNLSEKEIAFKNLNAKEFANQGFPNKKDENWKYWRCQNPSILVALPVK